MKLIAWIRRIVKEADASTEQDLNADDNCSLRALGVVIVRIWALIFQGNTQWPIIHTVGRSLEIYADMLESDPG